jgi:hypothetical protein
MNTFMGAAAGSVVERFVFRNVSSRTCLLRGSARVSGVGPGGRRVRLRPEPVHGDIGAGSIIPADIRPGGFGELLMEGLDVEGPGACAMQAYSDVAFRIPSGGRVRSSTRLVRPCSDWQMTELGLPQRYPTAPPHPALGPGALTVSIQLPARIRPGSSLRYVVVLRNPTGSAIRLSPCPRYEELLFGTEVVRREYWLNCAAAHPIGAHASERFAMALPIPRSVGQATKFSWILGVRGTPAAVVAPPP